MKSWIVSGLAAYLILPATGHAMFMQPGPIPLERIATNTRTYIEAHPDDAAGYYTLGRIYYLGFVNQAALIPGFNEGADGQLPGVAPDWLSGNFSYQLINAEAEKRALKEMGITERPDYSSENREPFQKLQQEYIQKLQDENWKPEAISSDTALQYAGDAKTYFQKAIALDAGNGLYRLGLASLNEQVFNYLTENKLESAAFTDLKKDDLLNGYWTAFEHSKDEDAALSHRPVSGLASLVSFEAGRAWIRLGGKDEARTGIIQDHLDKLDHLQMGAITPLVITDAEIVEPGAFVRKDLSVCFDLDGEGHAEAWEWVTPETAFLVWDPGDHRSIRSGTQLFGNYTFRIIWSDGFRALSVLDDNMDGVIAGNELDGLSVWYDRNSNGISEPDEVKPVQTEGITSLAYDHPETCEGILVQRGGVAYGNGPAAHLWDWISYTQPDE